MKYIHVYSRKQAIEDGVLVDVSEMAKEVGIMIPVAVTKRLWEEVITPDPNAIGQSINGRLWDALFLLHIEIKRSKFHITSLPFTFSYQCVFVMGEKDHRLFQLKAVLSNGDDLKPVFTIMLPDED